MQVNLSWGKRVATTFTVSHSGHAKWPTGVVAPQYARVVVNGVPAFWQLSPSPVIGDPNTQSVTNAQSVNSLKSGYVVTLLSMGLSHSQVEQALAVILSHL